MSTTEINNLAINTIRTLCIDTIDKANSGHPGLPMGAAPMAYALWQNHLRHNPSNPQWPNRDRFVLSAGHGSTLLYSLLHLTGYELGLDDLKNFRQWESKTPGHPEFGHTAGVEATTGPLGQGAANAVGMAMAERAMASLYNREGYELFDHQTYALVGDGDLMEGVAYEAVSLAGTLGLGKLTYLYDSNDITLDGPAELTFTEDVAARFEASGWHVQTVKDGDTDIDGISGAIEKAKAESSKPSLIIVRTTIGYGSPNRQGTSGIHGSPLGTEERALAKKELGWDFADDFHVPAEVAKHMGAAKEKGKGCQKEWGDKLAAYGEAHPELAKELALALAGKLPEGWKDKLPKFEVSDQLATRQSGGKVVNAIAQAVPNFFGGDADLSVSTGTGLKGEENFNGQSGAGRNIRYGIREHAMGAIANGIAYHGGLRSFISTFFVFTDYLRPALRLAAMSKLPVIGVFTHDSIGLGEDGPTHQPVEQLAALRAIPNLHILRPADANETREAWIYAMERNNGPTLLVLSRQKLATLDPAKYAGPEGVHQGAYILAEAEGGTPKALIIGTGSEVQLALGAKEVLEKDGIPTRVVSMPSWEAFSAQSASYQDEVLPPGLSARVSIEAGVGMGWERWVGNKGAIISVETYGASAPANIIAENYGLTVENVVAKAKELV